MFTSRKILRSYHGKVTRLLEALYVAVRQQRIIHQVGGNDIPIPGPSQEQLNWSP
jgi:hypothetical protein